MGGLLRELALLAPAWGASHKPCFTASPRSWKMYAGRHRHLETPRSIRGLFNNEYNAHPLEHAVFSWPGGSVTWLNLRQRSAASHSATMASLDERTELLLSPSARMDCTATVLPSRVANHLSFPAYTFNTHAAETLPLLPGASARMISQVTSTSFLSC